MSKCFKCGTEFTLKEEEIFCDNCKEKVNFCCHNCKNWFSVCDDSGNKLKECKWCGFFICPFCNSCGTDCSKYFHTTKLREIISNFPNENIAIRKIIDYFENIKLCKDRKNCLKGVPISYAKGRIKSCIVRLQGFRTKSQEDINAFVKRFDEITDKDLGMILTINNSRENGSYGQEYRDVFNLGVCQGKLKYKKLVKQVGNQIIEYEVWERCEEETCSMLDIKNLISRICPQCKTSFNKNILYCDKCKYKKGSKKHQKGSPIKLELKISNKDICQLSRSLFKTKKEEDEKDGEMGYPEGFRPINEWGKKSTEEL